MKALAKLFDRIIQRVNINLRELEYDVNPYIQGLIPFQQLVKFYAFYGITPHHPLDMEFRHSNLAGSYFLGKCRVTNCMLYKSDIRGDELKANGDIFKYQDFEIPVCEDEGFVIEDSLLIKTLVHNFSHDPETLEKFFITNTVSAHYANIHGSPTDGSFLGPFATVDLTSMNDCVIGAFSYVQAGEISHLKIDPGTIWVRQPGDFNFLYRYPQHELRPYISFSPGEPPQGILMAFVQARKEAFQRVFNTVNIEASVNVPKTASLDRYAVIQPKTHISDNVLIAQRAFLQNAWMGEGANAQENCYIINSRLEGFNVTAHGAKIIEADLGRGVFVGFNSFLRGRPECPLTIGAQCIIMPHTIIDLRQPVSIPPDHLVWGHIQKPDDLKFQTLSLKKLASVRRQQTIKDMKLRGNGAAFVQAFRLRIRHILEANGAYFNGKKNRGHAQQGQNISFNIIQPYSTGKPKGLFPTLYIQP